jgi:acetyl esterase/lipase
MSLVARIAKKLLHLQFSGWSDGTIKEQRARQEKTVRYARLPRNIRCQNIHAAGVSAAWVDTADSSLGVILYLHGGAYAMGSINTHREFIARLVIATKMRALTLNYRLAPEHPYPAAVKDATTAYLWLLEQGYDPSKIIIAGDSAGGGLNLATLVTLREDGVPLPAGAVCISPWMDLAMTGASIQSKAKVDPVLDPDSLEMYAKYYAGEHDRTSPLISPLYADLTSLPPLLIQVGSDEILLDDATRFAENARCAGLDVSLEIWDKMFHVFQIIPFLPETKKAVRSIAGFTTQNLNKSEFI